MIGTCLISEYWQKRIASYDFRVFGSLDLCMIVKVFLSAFFDLNSIATLKKGHKGYYNFDRLDLKPRSKSKV